MPKRAERVLIAGGGIGGLAAAIALGRQSISTEILERSRSGDETGAGIQLGPNATRALETLGLLDTIAPFAFRPDAIWLHDGLSGRKLTTVPLGRRVVERYGAPYLTLQRSDLHAALGMAAASMSTVNLRQGFEVADIEAQGAEILARAAGGTQVMGTSLIGADGLWSTVRPCINPYARLRHTGATAWRALLPRKGLPPPLDAPVVGLWLGPRAHLVHYPLRGGDDLNIVAVTEGGAARQGWNEPADAKALVAHFAGWSREAQSVLQQAQGWRSWSLYRLDGLSRYSMGRIALLGDAAHPILPYLAQGAALAIEDAVTLALSIAQCPGDPPNAFRRYETWRQPRDARVQRLSRRLGRLYHLSGPFRLARNLLLERRREESALQRFDWLYGEGRRTSP
jgi:3-hydroxybenzoate 6-monooxygenase